VRVNWVAYNTVELKDGELYSRVASARYRVIQPITGLAQRGHVATLVQFDIDDVPDHVMTQFDAEVVVFSKLITPNRDHFGKLAATTRTIIDRLRSTGRRVVADLNDNYFEHPFYGEFFRDLVGRVDAVVTSTPEMSALVARYTARPVPVVTDAFEGPRGAPRFTRPARRSSGWFGGWFGKRSGGSEPLQLVWFGHPTNWKAMRTVVESMLELREWTVELEIVTAPGRGVEQFCDEFNARHSRVCRLRFTPWSLAATWGGLARAALVLIPSAPYDAGKAVKSPNRLVESLRAGRFTVASSIPSYRSLAPYCWLGDSIVEGLKWALDHPDEAQQRALEGQRLVEATYSPTVVAGAWEAVLASPGAAGAQPTPCSGN
jgi:glycosyltransferase involved in cell wall biosynthesis